MYYKPHTLQIRQITGLERDDYGRPVSGTGSESWYDVCQCRCDDNTTNKLTSDNVEAYVPQYHIVCEEVTGVKAGDYVRCMDGGNVRCEGEVYMVKRTNYLGYSEVWI